MEHLAFEQAPGSGVLGTGDCRQPTDSGRRREASDEGGHGGGADAFASRGRGQAVTDLDAALTVARAVGPQIADGLVISAADDKPDDAWPAAPQARTATLQSPTRRSLHPRSIVDQGNDQGSGQ